MPKESVAWIEARVTETEKKKVLAEAKLAGLSVSELIRRKVFGRVITPRLPKVDEMAVSRLKILGGQLKQLYARDIVDKQATREVLDEIAETLKFIRKGSA